MSLEDECGRLENELHLANQRIAALESQEILPDLAYSKATREDIWEEMKNNSLDGFDKIEQHMFKYLSKQLEHGELWEIEDSGDWQDLSVSHRTLDLSVTFYKSHKTATAYFKVPEGDIHKEAIKAGGPTPARGLLYSLKDMRTLDIVFS